MMMMEHSQKYAYQTLIQTKGFFLQLKDWHCALQRGVSPHFQQTTFKIFVVAVLEWQREKRVRNTFPLSARIVLFVKQFLRFSSVTWSLHANTTSESPPPMGWIKHTKQCTREEAGRKMQCNFVFSLFELLLLIYCMEWLPVFTATPSGSASSFVS